MTYEIKLGIGNILSTSVDIYKDNIQNLLYLILMISIPANLLGVAGGWIGGIFKGLGSLLLTIALILGTDQILKSKKIIPQKLITKSFDFFIPVFIAVLVTTLFVALWSVLLIIPGIIFMTYWMFVHFIVIFKKKGVIDAQKLSRKMVTGKWWELFGYFIIFCLISMGGIAIINMIFNAGNVIGILLRGIGSDIITSFLVIAMTLLYFAMDK